MTAPAAPRSGQTRRLAVGLGLVVLLIGVYFATYTGHGVSDDEWLLFDATESMARRGDLRTNFHFDATPPLSLKHVQPPSVSSEPLQPLLAVPLFWIGSLLPGVGLVHTVWLFSLFNTALTAGVLYAWGLALGYRGRVAGTVALLYGLATIAWPYSRTYFREPLFTLLALSSAYGVLRARQVLSAGRRPYLYLAGAGLALAGALLAKESTLLLVPVILIEALPARLGNIRLSRRTLGVLIVLIVLILVLGWLALNADRIFDISRYAFADRIKQARGNLSQVPEGVAGYLFSPARSLWLFSPVLLAGFAGWRRLLRQGRGRQIATPLAMLVIFVVGYAAVRGPEWYGGLGWGARYLVPVAPFMALWLLPVVERLWESSTPRWQRAAFGALVIVSVLQQIVGILLPANLYTNVLNDQEPRIIPWKEGAWSLRWSPVRVNLDLLRDGETLDFAWSHAHGMSWLQPVLALALVALAAGWLAWWGRRARAVSSTRPLAITAFSMGGATILALGVGLYSIRQDPRYGGAFQPALDLLDVLEAEVQDDEVILLNDPTYARFFMNYYRRDEPRVLTLPLSPGEQPSPEQAPKIASAFPDELVHLSDTLIIGELATHTPRAWLVINSSRFITWAVRPVEHYLARHYFPVREVQATDTARAVLFDLTPAPSPTAAAWPDQRVDALFGEEGRVQLVGFDVPGGTTRQAGDVLPVSLLWQANDAIPLDYTVALFLIASDGALVAQQDTFPEYYFAPTSTWRPGALLRDNHGLALPADLAPGEYELWLALYHWETPTERLPITALDGTSLGSHITLATVTVQ